jgi:hypothetical protein
MHGGKGLASSALLPAHKALREQLREEKPGKRRAKLPVWQGNVKGFLRREKIYSKSGVGLHFMSHKFKRF